MACHQRPGLGPAGNVQERGIAPLLRSLRGPRRPGRGLRFYRSFYRTGRNESMPIDAHQQGQERTCRSRPMRAFDSGTNDTLGSEFNSHNAP
jgi:hypothetical protein